MIKNPNFKYTILLLLANIMLWSSFIAKGGNPLPLTITANDYDVNCNHPYAMDEFYTCLLYTSPSPRDGLLSRMPSSA